MKLNKINYTLYIIMAKTLKKKYKEDSKNKKKRKTQKKYNKKSIKRARKPKKKTLKKKQKGGSLIAIGARIGSLALAAAGAFASYKYSGLVKEKNKIDLLLGQSSNIEYLPKLLVTKDKNSIE